MAGRSKLVKRREGLEKKLDAGIEQMKCRCGCQLVNLAVDQQSWCNWSEASQRGVNSYQSWKRVSSEMLCDCVRE